MITICGMGIEKPTYNIKEEVDVRPLMDKKPDWMTVDCDFHREIVGCPWFHGVARHRHVMRVDEGFIQIQDQGLPLDDSKPMS